MDGFNMGDVVVFFQNTQSQMPFDAIGHSFVITIARDKSIGSYRAQGITYKKQCRFDTDWWFSGKDLRLLPQTVIEKEIRELESMGYRDLDE